MLIVGLKPLQTGLTEKCAMSHGMCYGGYELYGVRILPENVAILIDRERLSTGFAVTLYMLLLWLK